MATGVEELLEMLFSMIDEAKSVPLSSEKCIIERDRALDLLDDIKAQFPMEADLIRKQAEEKARQLLAEDELAAQARQKANEMLKVAEERSRELRRAANEYCEDTLRRTEEAVSEAYDEIKRSRARFRAAVSGAQPAAGAGGGQPGRAAYDAEADK